jgi:hypothetical protein
MGAQHSGELRGFLIITEMVKNSPVGLTLLRLPGTIGGAFIGEQAEFMRAIS